MLDVFSLLRWMCGVTRRNRIRNNYIKGTVKVVEISKKIAVVWSCPAERGGSCVQKGHGHGGGWEEDKGKAKIYRLKDSVSNGMQEMSLRDRDEQYRRRRKRLTGNSDTI